MANKNSKLDNGKTRTAAGGLDSAGNVLSAQRCLEIHKLMARARALEERMIKMSKSGEGYFRIGGPAMTTSPVQFSSVTLNVPLTSRLFTKMDRECLDN